MVHVMYNGWKNICVQCTLSSLVTLINRNDIKSLFGASFFLILLLEKNKSGKALGLQRYL